ncbi:MAG TPA: preprotein translocase subunit SecA, partial [Candidatus Hydrogenedentes bacterium]|nr:preprotein translocase subunit SecA [Candidatus Hydrogenedentota bacterium]
MLDTLLKTLFGTNKDRQVKRLSPLLGAVRELELKYMGMSNDQLRSQTGRLKDRLAQGESLDDLLPDAFAVCCEAAKRVTGMRPFDVQIFGGAVLHQGAIAEMVTGEGKTLV